MEIFFGACIVALLLFIPVMMLVNKRIDRLRTERLVAAAQDDPWINPEWRDPMMRGS